MGTKYNPAITRDGLALYFDAANTRSYAGSGNTVFNIAQTSAIGATLSSGVSFLSNPSTFAATASNLLLSDMFILLKDDLAVVLYLLQF